MRDRRNDILIGSDEWIEFVDLDGRHDLAVEVDPHLGGLWPLIDRLETECDSGCCGFTAFDFTRVGIEDALEGLDRRRLHTACANAMSAVEQVDSSVIMSRRLNNLADKRMFLRLLDHIRECVARDLRR